MPRVRIINNSTISNVPVSEVNALIKLEKAYPIQGETYILRIYKNKQNKEEICTTANPDFVFKTVVWGLGEIL